METPTFNNLKTTSTLQEFISANKQTEFLLQSIGIPTDSYQEKSLLQICIEKKWNEKELLSWLRKQTSRRQEKRETESIDFNELDRKQLLQFYKKIRNRLNRIVNEFELDFHRVCKVHGVQYPILKEMHWHLDKISEKVRYDLMMTDKTITPLLKSSNTESNSILYGEAKKYERSINLVVQDQHQIANHIQKIEKMNPHPDGVEGSCGTIKTAFQDMNELFSEIDTYFELLRNGIIPKLNQAINTD
jgi:iron-sulfur cluster repair protein YtfE (RIC family)